MPGPDAVEPPTHAKSSDPLHGMTLEAIVMALHARYGWAGLGERIRLRCFTSEPSLGSSLKFLRKTPWAREKVEGLYCFMLREARRAEPGCAAVAPGERPSASARSRP